MTLVTKLELIRGGEALDISDEVSYIHEENDGFGMAPFHRMNERGPMQDGATDRGYRLDPRVISLVIPMIGASWSERYARRAELLRILKPGEDTIILQFTDPDGSVYRIDCHTTAGPMFGSQDMWGNQFKAAFSLYAPDPTWYSTDALSVDFSLGGGSDKMEVPTVIPMTVGASTIDMTQVINYAGSFKSYPIIKITGPITDCVITNTYTGDKLDFTGATIAAGDYYEIDCRYGYKTVVDSVGANQVSDLTSDSDLSSFSIESGTGSEALPNSIQVQGSAITVATKVAITVFERYIGV